MKKIIAVVGDSKISKDSLKYQLAFDLGKALVDHGYVVLSGGMKGVMEAVFHGAKSSEKSSDNDTIGIIPSFDDQDANSYTDIAIPTGLDLYRNGIVANSHAVIAIGGGSGTLSEIAHAWALYRLVIGYKHVDGWSAKLANTVLDQRKRYEDIEDKVFGVENANDVIKILEEKLQIYTRRHKRIV